MVRIEQEIEIKPGETVRSYADNHLNQVYLHSLPIYLQFLIFLHRGVYNGFTNFRLSRILCYLNRHNWSKYEFDNVAVSYRQCIRCGMPSKSYGQSN